MDHVVGFSVFGRYIGKTHIGGMKIIYQVQAAVNGGQHTQRQAIHFKQSQGFQVILVPLDDGAVCHRSILHGHQRGQRVFRNDKTTHMLGQVTRETDQALYQVQ